MQRAIKPRRTAVHPRNALRVADKQSFGLLVGFLLRYVRLAATCRGHDDSALAPRPGPAKAGSTSFYRRADLSVQQLVDLRVFSDLSMSQLGHYAKKKLPGLPDRWTTTAGRN